MAMLTARRLAAAAMTAVALCACDGSRPGGATGTVRSFDVRSFGAVGDGTTADTAAVQRALDAAANGGGQVVVPAGTFVVGSLRLGSHVTLRLDAGATLQGSPDANDYPLANVHYEGEAVVGHAALLHAEHATNVAVVGPGTLAGSAPLGELRRPRGPVMVEFTDCHGVRLDGFRDRYHRMWSIHLLDCDDVVARGLDIRTTGNNGDGIDIESSTDVRIDHCTMDTGDDCVSLKSGRGLAAYRRGRPTARVTITNCTLGSAFAPIGVGTEMSGGVRDLRVEHCTFTRGANAVFIKSRVGRGGVIRDVAFDDIDSSGTRTFLGIDLVSKGIVGTEPVPGDEGLPAVANVRVSHVRVACGRLVDGTRIPDRRPLDGLWLTDVSGSADRGINLANVTGLHLDRVGVAVATGPRLALHNVTGTGLADAVDPGPPDLTPARPPRR